MPTTPKHTPITDVLPFPSSFGFVPGATPPVPPPGSPRRRVATSAHRAATPPAPSSGPNALVGLLLPDGLLDHSDHLRYKSSCPAATPQRWPASIGIDGQLPSERLAAFAGIRKLGTTLVRFPEIQVYNSTWFADYPIKQQNFVISRGSSCHREGRQVAGRGLAGVGVAPGVDFEKAGKRWALR